MDINSVKGKSMKKMIFQQVPLYRFLQCCEEASEATGSKRILDCGAGGDKPPLSLFSQYGYITSGVDFSQSQVHKANAFGDTHNQSLGIEFGDMTKLAFESEHFDFVYSYNSIFHMKKKEILIGIQEMKRVLKPSGLLFVNFLSVDDFRCGEGPHLGDHQYEQMDDEPVIHSYFDYDEADEYFSDMDTLIKERRVIERIYEGKRIRQGFIDYILRKHE